MPLEGFLLGPYRLLHLIGQGGTGDASSSFIHTDQQDTNTLAAVAQNNTFALYINHQYVTTITDGNLPSGQIGVFTGLGSASFSNAKVWSL